MRILPTKEKWLPLILGGFLVFGSVWGVGQSQSFLTTIFTRLDYLIYDLMLRTTLGQNKLDESVKVVIVDIDEKSLREEGQWPWSRNKVAQLLNSLAEYGVPLVAFDMWFAEAEENRVKQAVDSISDEELHKETLQQVLDELAPYFDADQRFVKTMNSVREEYATDVVLGYVFRLDDASSSVGQLPTPISIKGDVDVSRLLVDERFSYTGNLSDLQMAAEFGGYVSVDPDEDGLYRRLPLFYKYQNHLFPSIDLEVARVWLTADEIELKVEERDGHLEIKEVALASNYIVPTDEKGQVLIPFQGPAFSFPYVSAADVLNKRALPEELEGAIVLIGTSASGLQDLRSTPVAKKYPGVEMHANMIAAILSSFQNVSANDTGGETGNFKTPFPYGPDWAIDAEFWVTLVAGLLMAMILPFCGPSMLVSISVAILSSLLFLTFACWDAYNVVIKLSMPFAVVFLVGGFNLSYNFIFERRRYRQLKGLFGQYIPPMLVEQMSRDPSQLTMDGETRNMTVLFADIRSFTTISESLDASELKKMLNRFFTPMTEVIFHNRGTIDKYVGDMIMAFWGAPLQNDDHAEYAISSALDMLAQVKKLHPQFAADGLPEVNIGIGLNSGMMNVGDMGSIYRRSYTVIGDAVNLASRLEGLTKYYGVGLVVGEDTRAGQTKFVFRKLDLVKVKGKQVGITVYEPVCRIEEATPELYAEIARHEEGLTQYLQRDWVAAEATFTQLAGEYPDRVIYDVYLERIATLRKRKLPDDWDGVYERREK